MEVIIFRRKVLKKRVTLNQNSFRDQAVTVDEGVVLIDGGFLRQTGAVSGHWWLEGSGGGGGGDEKQDGFLKAAASQPKGQRAQLDIQRADADASVLWVLPIRGVEAAGDQESPER